jgi:hypothetical protein
MPLGAEGAREQNLLAFGAAAAQVILNDKDFHCPHPDDRKSRRSR